MENRCNRSLTDKAKEAMAELGRKIGTTFSPAQTPRYTLEYIMSLGCHEQEIIFRTPPGTCYVSHDQSMKKWRLRVQLDKVRLWFLSVFVHDDGSFDKYSLDLEAANDCHYEFVEEEKIRKALYAPGDENQYFHEILIRYVQQHGGDALLDLIRPCIAQAFCYWDFDD